MKTSVSVILLLLLTTSAISGAELDAVEIIRRADALLRRDASHAEMEMTITRPEWTRTLTMEAWSKDADQALIRILSPRKEKGIGFLKKGREAWQFIPAIDRTIKIPPSMMLQSWLGSDFTNDDVVRADSIVVDYDHRILHRETQIDAEFWMIESIPKPDAAVVWGKIHTWVNVVNLVPRLVQYFDEDGKLIKYYETADIKHIEGADVATRLTMIDVSRPGHRTELTYEKLTFSPKLRSDTFSLRNLKR